MEEVTDTVFRRLVLSLARPHVLFTEFTSTDGICSPGRDEVSKRLAFLPIERPIVAQLWGKNPEFFRRSGALLRELGFDGLDINLGCPVKKVVSKGCCAALIDSPQLVKEIYLAASEGFAGGPVSIKTRLGNRRQVTEEWASYLLNEVRPAALTIHARTAKEESKVPARWEEISKVVAIRDQCSPSTLVIGNGDIFTHEQLCDAPAKFGVDGVMVGRGIFRDPLIFRTGQGPSFNEMPIEFRLSVMRKHIESFDQQWQGRKDFSVLKRFFKIYISGFEGAVALRTAMMEVKTSAEALELLGSFSARAQTASDTTLAHSQAATT